MARVPRSAPHHPPQCINSQSWASQEAGFEQDAAHGTERVQKDCLLSCTGQVDQSSGKLRNHSAWMECRPFPWTSTANASSGSFERLKAEVKVRSSEHASESPDWILKIDTGCNL